MSYEWMLSAKGNQYTKIDDRLCVIGKSKYGWWVLVEDQFLEGNFGTEEDAKNAGIKALTRKLVFDAESANHADN
jgi:hypothetical protein